MKYAIGINMNKKILVNISLITSFLTILTLSATVEAETKLYKWVDSQGRISYQGKPPPKNSKILSEETLGSSKRSSDEGKINTSSIDVYVTADCASCDKTVGILKEWGVPHQVKNIEDSREIQGILIEQTNGVRVPALFSGEQLISSTSSRDGLKESLTKTGHIDPSALESASTKDAQETESN